MRPRLFIGSSRESIGIAENIHSNLDEIAEVTPWNKGTFGLNESGLESLMRQKEEYDFACFIVRREDIATVRGELRDITRDNVILEIGLFLGAIGRERVFIIHPRGARPDLPSDLDGITLLDYDANRRDRNYQAALTKACLAIKQKIQQLGHKKLPTVIQDSNNLHQLR